MFEKFDLDAVVVGKLPAGKYSISVVDVDTSNLNNGKGGYIKVTYQFPNRLLSVCYFDNNFSYFQNNLDLQLNGKGTKTLRELIELAKKPNALFGVVSYSEEFGFNLALHQASSIELPDVKF